MSAISLAQDAEVVCNYLGYPTGMATINSRYGPGSGRIALDHVDCTGRESALWECPAASVVDHTTCDHTKDAGVICTGSDNGPCECALFLRFSELIQCL